jgi:hypothetical protein
MFLFMLMINIDGHLLVLLCHHDYRNAGEPH